MEQNCSRCDCGIDRPIRRNSNYVTHTDFVEDEHREVSYAMVHTEETKEWLDKVNEKVPDKDRQTLAAEIANPDADDELEIVTGTETIENESGSVETAKKEVITFSVPVEKFDHVRIKNPDVVQDDPEVAYTYTNVEPVPVQKTAVICSDCTGDDDEIIWGVDK